MRVGYGLAVVAVLTMAACERGAPQLMNIRSQTRSPDEFTILPTKPLQLPEDLASLPDHARRQQHHRSDARG